MARGSTTTVRSPSEAAYTAALSPAGPAPMTATSKIRGSSEPVQQAEGGGDLDRVRIGQDRTVRPEPQHHHGQVGRAQPQGVEQGLTGGLRDVVEPGRHLVAAEHVAELLGALRPPLADDLHRLVGVRLRSTQSSSMPVIERWNSSSPGSPGRKTQVSSSPRVIASKIISAVSSSPQRTTPARTACGCRSATWARAAEPSGSAAHAGQYRGDWSGACLAARRARPVKLVRIPHRTRGRSRRRSAGPARRAGRRATPGLGS